MRMRSFSAISAARAVLGIAAAQHDDVARREAAEIDERRGEAIGVVLGVVEAVARRDRRLSLPITSA